MLVTGDEYRSDLLNFMRVLKAKNQDVKFKLIDECLLDFDLKNVRRNLLLTTLEMFDDVSPEVQGILGIENLSISRESKQNQC
jgi:hypothetical protein